MKKVFFTAIAMIAFTNLSMANTIADEEVVTEEKKEVVLKTKEDKCLNAWVNTFNANVDEYGDTVASNMATAAWGACREALYPGE